MTEMEFDEFLFREIPKCGRDYISEAEIDYTPHDFSEEFLEKMRNLIESFSESE